MGSHVTWGRIKCHQTFNPSPAPRLMSPRPLDDSLAYSHEPRELPDRQPLGAEAGGAPIVELPRQSLDSQRGADSPTRLMASVSQMLLRLLPRDSSWSPAAASETNSEKSVLASAGSSLKSCSTRSASTSPGEPTYSSKLVKEPVDSPASAGLW